MDLIGCNCCICCAWRPALCQEFVPPWKRKQSWVKEYKLELIPGNDIALLKSYIWLDRGIKRWNWLTKPTVDCGKKGNTMILCQLLLPPPPPSRPLPPRPLPRRRRPSRPLENAHLNSRPMQTLPPPPLIHTVLPSGDPWPKNKKENALLISCATVGQHRVAILTLHLWKPPIFEHKKKPLNPVAPSKTPIKITQANCGEPWQIQKRHLGLQ